MNPKKWLLGFLTLSIIFIAGISSFNYYVDPYGYQSRENKYMRNLSEISKTTVLHNRLISEGYYYLIGTSRLVRLDPSYIEKISKKKTHNIHIDGSTLKENLLLANYVKKKKKNFIYGFDAFSLNESRLEHKEIQHRYETYKMELSSNPNIFTQYFNSELFSVSMKHRRSVKKNRNFYEKFSVENGYQYTYTIDAVNNNKGYDNKQQKKNFSNYKSYSQEKIIELASLASKEDIFIIYPKHYYNYILFDKYQKINQQYLFAIKTLVENTKAKVWSFYQFNDITKDSNNFDAYGWHFKPNIGKLIFARIFNKPNNLGIDSFGTLLTKENINDYLLKLKSDLEEYN